MHLIGGLIGFKGGYLYRCGPGFGSDCITYQRSLQTIIQLLLVIFARRSCSAALPYVLTLPCIAWSSMVHNLIEDILSDWCVCCTWWLIRCKIVYIVFALLKSVVFVLPVCSQWNELHAIGSDSYFVKCTSPFPTHVCTSMLLFSSCCPLCLCTQCSVPMR